MSRPNILFITTDQQRFDHIGLAGLRGIETPTLDRIGREGAHFTRAYCPTPLCTPTRLSLLTGVMPSIHRAHTLGVTAEPFPNPTIPQRLKENGYATALVGKSHFTERRLEEAHLLEAIGEYRGDAQAPFDGPYLGFEQVQLASGHNVNCDPQLHYKRYLDGLNVDYKAWFPVLSEGSYDGEAAGVWDIPAEHHNTAWVGAQTRRWLEDYTQPETPFFCWMSFEDPHEPMRCPQPWFDRVDKTQLQAFEGDRAGEFDDKPAFYARAAAGDWSAIDDNYLTPCVFARRRLDEDAVTALQATLGMIAFIDDEIGRVLQLLETRGQLENTVVVFTADHGEMHGHHGFWGKGLTAYEDCQRVPLLIWAPGRGFVGGERGEIVNLIDLPRFFLNVAGLETPQGVQGGDLLSYLRGEAPQVRRGTLIESHITANIYQLTYVEERYKIVIYRDSDEGELYDLAVDPDQYRNLWHGEVELRAQMLLQMEQQRLFDEGHAHARRSFG